MKTANELISLSFALRNHAAVGAIVKPETLISAAEAIEEMLKLIARLDALKEAEEKQNRELALKTFAFNSPEGKAERRARLDAALADINATFDEILSDSDYPTLEQCPHGNAVADGCDACAADVLQAIEDDAEDEAPLEWVAGWNMPGYLPDSEPAEFETAEGAREYLAEEMQRAADETDDEDERRALEKAAETIVQNTATGWTEYGATIGKWHYFVNKI